MVADAAVWATLTSSRRCVGAGERLRQAHDQRHILGATPSPRFLPAPILLVPDRRALAHVKHANTLGAVELVGGKGEQVDSEIVDAKWQCPRGLDSIGVERDATVMRNRGNPRTGWIAPVSLLAYMIETRHVSGRIDASSAAGATMPSASTGKFGDSKALSRRA